MSKQVTSFRLSREHLEALDSVCSRLNKNRSEVISIAIMTLARDYVHKDGTLIRRTEWLLDPLVEE